MFKLLLLIDFQFDKGIKNSHIFSLRYMYKTKNEKNQIFITIFY